MLLTICNINVKILCDSKSNLKGSNLNKRDFVYISLFSIMVFVFAFLYAGLQYSVNKKFSILNEKVSVMEASLREVKEMNNFGSTNRNNADNTEKGNISKEGLVSAQGLDTENVEKIRVKKWESSYEQRAVYGPYSIDGLYLFVYSDSSYIIVDTKGALIKNGRFGNFQLMSKPLFENKNMYCTSSSGLIINYDFSLMKIVWQTSIGLASSLNLYFINNLILYSNPSGEVTFLQKKSGLIYKKETFHNLLVEPMSDGGSLIALMKDGFVRQYQIVNNTIEMIQEVELSKDFVPGAMYLRDKIVLLESAGKKYVLIEGMVFVNSVIEDAILVNDRILYNVNGVYCYRTNSTWVKVSKNNDSLQINENWGIKIKKGRLGVISGMYSDDVDYNGSELFIDKKAFVVLNEKKSIILWGIE